MFSSSLARSKLALPTGTWMLPNLSVRYSTRPPLNSVTALATSAVTVPVLGLGIRPRGGCAAAGGRTGGPRPCTSCLVSSRRDSLLAPDARIAPLLPLLSRTLPDGDPHGSRRSPHLELRRLDVVGVEVGHLDPGDLL